MKPPLKFLKIPDSRWPCLKCIKHQVINISVYIHLGPGHVGFVSFQGVRCFDYNASLQLMVTGGCDRAVRLWTRYVTTRPTATLLGHHATILDVAVYQPVQQILSYSRDAVSL